MSMKSPERLASKFILYKLCFLTRPFKVWFVSNCDQTNGAIERWKYGQQLIAAGLNVTGYGHCFNNLLRSSAVAKYAAPWVPGGLISHHKFYLAFENAIHCNDYISEKMWRNALRIGAVPIVFGPHR